MSHEFWYYMKNTTSFRVGTTKSTLDDDGVLEIDTTISLETTWHAMEELVSMGLVRSIGISNYGVVLTRDCLAYSKIKPAVNQIETHPYFQRDSLVKFCQKHGVFVTAHTPLGGATANTELFGSISCLDDPILQDLARKYNKSVAQIVLRWGIQRNTAVIPKTSKVKRLKDNFQVFDFELTKEDMDLIKTLDKELRTNQPAKQGLLRERIFLLPLRPVYLLWLLAEYNIMCILYLWNSDHGHVLEACKDSLKKLQLDYLDLYLVHFPVATKHTGVGTTKSTLDDDGVLEIDTTISLETTWHAMEELVSMGLVRSIGISNYGVVLTRDCLAYSKIKPAVNQIETHPYFQRDSLVKFCQKHGVFVTAHTPLGGATANTELFGSISCLDDPILQDLARKYNKSVAQIVLRWGIQRNTAVIPKTSKVKRLKDNFQVFDFELTKEDMDLIKTLDKELRTNQPAKKKKKDKILVLPWFSLQLHLPIMTFFLSLKCLNFGN
ncbi:hypothetical protein G4B88_013261 [Cannabis sativa]|uniref:NADP-dependent oxidoreductase domain-containing protein n=1 Tax=Cannabis sativa TaxID=3483 RepID=A0A7J6GZL3_CANSA|nr:hypothetical protein G4B88_013261 [Cannabis sativa]